MSARSREARLRKAEAVTEDAIHIPTVPKHIVESYGSARAWKALKRAQLKAAIEAMGEVRIGSAFFPRPEQRRYDQTLDAIQAGLASLRVLLSEKVWGR